MEAFKMTLFYTNSVKYLADKIKIKKGNFLLKKFSDGEIYVKILDEVKNKQVWVLASTNPPADNLLELIFLLDALKREKAKINLIITYFGYARQDRILKKEAFTSKLICDWLSNFNLNKIYVIHLHSQRLKNFLKYENLIPVELFSPVLKKAEVVVAPDKGALELVKKISGKYDVPYAYMEKFRPSQEEAKIMKLHGSVKNKKTIIIDDLVSTGGTILAAGKKLKQAGAKEISALATHGIFAGDAMREIEKSPIKKIYVTNSLLQKYRPAKIKVIELRKFIEKIIKA